MVELKKDIELLYKGMGGIVEFHTLGMPLTLRSNGGLGTHWMLPTNVSFKIPLNEIKSGNFGSCEKQNLSGEKTGNLIDQLHVKKPSWVNFQKIKRKSGHGYVQMNIHGISQSGKFLSSLSKIRIMKILIAKDLRRKQSVEKNRIKNRLKDGGGFLRLTKSQK